MDGAVAGQRGQCVVINKNKEASKLPAASLQAVD
jgi:hypothetical protein